MTTKLLALPLLGACVLLGACASEGSMPVANGDEKCDLEKVATVNEWASVRGYKVVWFGCPRPHEPVAVGQG
jgi:hypothetical protein